ncbi:MAG: hypothetical protein K2M10_08215 [Muribaculaceae bacterium]|nr:hypothetical protein [Muribaculaceae bacterium]MDE6299610.1 hypothetical protein [Muribaculaceae bacterium]
MNKLKIAGLILLFLLWFWLSRAVIINGGGFTLKNILVVTASAIIIFVPLWKKYYRNDSRR